MNVWGWSSPVGWAVFLVAFGAAVALLGWGLRQLAEATARFMALPTDKK